MSGGTNTLFRYLYRDASNYKQHGTMVLRGLHTAQQEQRLQDTLENGEGDFIAEQVGVPPLAGGLESYPTEDDHCWHAFEELSTTDKPPTDPRTVEEFVRDFEEAKRDGWHVFDPEDGYES